MHGVYDGKALQRRLKFADKCNIEEACWTSLVSWSFGGERFKNCFSQFCRPPQAPYAYCGKCEKYFKGVDQTPDKFYVAVV